MHQSKERGDGLLESSTVGHRSKRNAVWMEVGHFTTFAGRWEVKSRKQKWWKLTEIILGGIKIFCCWIIPGYQNDMKEEENFTSVNSSLKSIYFFGI